jgi:hypothetical protein
MKRPSASRSTSRPRPIRRGAGAAGARKTPTPGWKALGQPRGQWRNPKPPSVSASLELNLEEYFTATALMGILASQAEEPNQRWCCAWSFDMGKAMAKEARRRRKAGKTSS